MRFRAGLRQRGSHSIGGNFLGHQADGVGAAEEMAGEGFAQYRTSLNGNGDRVAGDAAGGDGQGHGGAGRDQLRNFDVDLP